MLEVIPLHNLYNSWHTIIRKGASNDSKNLFTTLKLWIPYLKKMGTENIKAETIARIINNCRSLTQI
jgi:hypothetical protein